MDSLCKTVSTLPGVCSQGRRSQNTDCDSDSYYKSLERRGEVVRKNNNFSQTSTCMYTLNPPDYVSINNTILCASNLVIGLLLTNLTRTFAFVSCMSYKIYFLRHTMQWQTYCC